MRRFLHHLDLHMTPLDESHVQKMLGSPRALIDKTFFFEDADTCYRVVSVVHSMDACIYRVQYEDDE